MFIKHQGAETAQYGLEITLRNTTNFIDTRLSNPNCRQHLAIPFRQSCVPPFYSVIGLSPLFLKIWRPLCALFVVIRGWLLPFKFTLASGVFAASGF